LPRSINQRLVEHLQKVLFREHVFLFAPKNEALEERAGHQWHAFWLNLKTGYDAFETQKRPPNVEVKDGLYVFDFQ
jgi:murein L,D-transpeptidase YafK